MTPAERRYSTKLVEAMKAAKVAEHQAAGRDVSFGVKLGKHRLKLELNFASVPEEQRPLVTHRCYAAAMKKALDADAMELLKVACCPTCREWFPLFAERNEHRRDHHDPAPTVYPADEARNQVIEVTP